MDNCQNETPDFDFGRSLKPPRRSRLPKIDRIINRPLAALIARAAFKLNLHPNHLTIISFVIGIAGALLFLGGNHRSFIAASIIVYISALFDGADGMLARSKNLCSRFGAYLDRYLDRITDFLVLGAMITGAYYQSERRGFFILCLFGLVVYHLQTLLYYLEREYYGVRSDSGAGGDYRGFFYVGVLVFSLINQIDLFLAVLLVIPVPVLIYRLIRYMLIERPEEIPPPFRRP